MNASNNKMTKSLISIYAIVLFVCILAFVIIPFDKIAASWICFAFTVVSIICSCLVSYKAFSTGNKLVSKVYGFSIFRVGIIYAIAQIIISVILCRIGAFVAVPYWIALLLSVILLGTAAIGFIITDSSRDFVEQIDESTRADVEKVTTFQISVAVIVDRCSDAETKAKLVKLDEALRYSDPVSNLRTAEIEASISSMIETLETLIDGNNSQEALALITKIDNKLKERNRICKASKGV